MIPYSLQIAILPYILILLAIIGIVAFMITTRSRNAKIQQLADQLGGLVLNNTIILVRDSHEIAMRYHAGTSKGPNKSPSYFSISTMINAPFFIVTKEGSIERSSKSIGLTSEVQTGDQAFDQLYFLDGEDGDYLARAFSDKRIREIVDSLFNQSCFRFHCRNKQLHIDLLTRQNLEHITFEQVNHCISALLSFKSLAPEDYITNPSNFKSQKNSSTPNKDILLFSLPLILLLIAGFIAIGFTAPYRTLTLELVFFKMLMYTAPLAIIYFYWMMKKFRGHSDAHKNLYFLGVLLIMAVANSTLWFGIIINGSWDKGEVSTLRLAVHDKIIHKPKRSHQKNYVLVFEDKANQIKHSVSQDEYEAAARGITKYEIEIMPGYFDSPWIRSFRLLK